MKKVLALAGATLTVLAAGCAADGSVPAESPSERLYVTGSNIPKKANAPADANTPAGMGLRVYSREDVERMQALGANQNPDSKSGR